MGVIVGVLLQGKATGHELLRMKCSGDYLDLKEKKWQKETENDMMKSLILFT
jgi:hypothetical protein